MTKNRECPLGAIVVVLLLAGILPAADNDNPLATLRKEHPRLLFTAADQKRIEDLAKTEPLLARLIEQNRVNATAMLSRPPVKYEIPDGKRLLGQSRKCIERVAAMAMAYRLSGDRKFADAAISEMLITTKFKDFNPPHFLDTAEMTTALAIGYDWLYDVISPADRKTIREAIVRMGLQPGIQCYEKGGWWVRGHNNWNQVCNGGMILGALAVAEDEKELAKKTVTAAVKSIPNGTGAYAPDGAYPEGPGYWQYGTSYTALTIMGLKSALGADCDISKTPALDETGLFRIHTLGPTGQYFNYADCGKWFRPASTMFALSRTYDRPLFAWWHRQQLLKQIPLEGKVEPRRLDRFFPLEIAWYDPRGEKPTLEELPRQALFHGVQDIVTMRSKWDDPDAVFVGFKGGDNRANHGHLDIGSFVLDAGGVRWVVDLGSDNYNMPGYFGRQRWEYYRLNNRSHNTLVIGDKLQNTAAVAKVVDFGATTDSDHSTVDMSDAYKGQATRVVRTIELVDRRVVRVLDEVTDPKGEVRWAVVTEADVRLAGNKAVLKQSGKTLEVEIVSPPGVKLEIVPTKPPTSRENQNRGARMLAARLRPVEGEMRIEVLFRP